ncbi:hypothetical protein [Anabaena subtropica]|uniref:Uncharacterized protein n=1 Tax=Anabaena subtropica FACHB-260 TaxID=2692884 RepID=A0ABR8CIV1_9NOST|nr:hypothetical protein [Anabaena subtropica]MBD2343116.1 hypothetical protein [Anabaena subtropica FACHB-260]
MLSQTIASDLLADLSTDEQQLLAGGFRKSMRGCGCNGGSGNVGTEGSTPAVSPIKTRMAVGHIITVSPFAKCLNGGTTNGSGTTNGNDD